MNQNSIFSYVKRNNNNEGVDRKEQRSSKIKEAHPLKHTKCNSITKVKNGTTHN